MIIPFVPREVQDAREISEVEVEGRMSALVNGVDLSNYAEKVELFTWLYDEGFEAPVLQQSITFLDNLRRAAMRCDPRVAQEIYRASERLIIKLVS